MADEIRINSPKELEAWLEDKPHEWARVIAIRTALRVLPLARRVMDAPNTRLQAKQRQGLILQSFRAAAISRSSAEYPSHKFAALTVAADAVYAAARTAYPDAEGTAYDAATAVADVAYAFTSKADAAVYTAARAAAEATSAAANIAEDRVVGVWATWMAVGADVNWLEQYIKAIGIEALERRQVELVRRPLWTLGIPQWFARERLNFDKRLRDLGGHWPIWSDWLGRRIAGDNTAGLPDDLAEELDIKIATQSDDWWSRDPVQVNAEIAQWIEEAIKAVARESEPVVLVGKRVDEEPVEHFVQSPAPFSYVVRDGKLHAVPQSGDVLDEATANEILFELIEKAREHSDRLSGKGNIAPRLKRNADSLVSALEKWAETPNPGVLLMRLRSMEADVGAYDTTEGRAELYPDAIAGMLDITRSLEDFVSLQPVAQKMQAAALALHIQRSDVIEINVNIEAIRAAAANMENVNVSVPESLAEGQPDFEEATLAIETTTDEVKKADAIEKRAEITAYKVMSVRNFGRGFIGAVQSGALKGTEEGVKGVVSGGIKVGAAAVAGVLAGPFVALGVFIASLNPLGKRMKEIADADKDKPIDV